MNEEIITMSQKIDRLMQYAIETNEKLGLLATKDHVQALEDRMTAQLDEQSVILQRLDQERVFTLDRVRQLEGEVERIKLKLKIA